MQALRKFLAGLLLIMVACLGLYAQPTPKKPDIIQKLDNTQLEVIIDEINKTDILYRKVNDPKGPLYAVPRKDVRKIIWNNGDVEDITIPPEPIQKPGNPLALLKKKEKVVLFWDHPGLYAGLRLGAGAGMVVTPSAPALASDITPVYNGGVTLGYHVKALSVQVEALYTAMTYHLIVPENDEGITKADGQQQNLMVPLTVSVGTHLGKIRVGLTVGGFGALQVGNGSILITSTDTAKKNVKNCPECTDKFTYGAVGGLMATLIEKPKYAIYIDARWYHNLSNNEAYKIAESGVKMHTGIVGVGALFNLSRK